MTIPIASTLGVVIELPDPANVGWLEASKSSKSIFSGHNVC